MFKRYYISFNSTDFSEVFPATNPITTYTQIEGMRIWREELEQIKLLRQDNITVYDTLESYFTDKTKFDTEIELEIYTGTRATGTLYWSGKFSISDSNIDIETKVFEIKPRINDNYAAILEKADIDYELYFDTSLLEAKRIGYAETAAFQSAWSNPGVGYSTAFATFDVSGSTILTAVTGGLDVYGATIVLPPVSTGDVVIIDVLSYSKDAGADPTIDIHHTAGDVSLSIEGPRTIAAGAHAFTASTNYSAPRLAFAAAAGTFHASFALRIIQVENAHYGAEELMTFIENLLDSSTHMYLTAYTGNVVSTFFNNDALPSDAPSTIDTWMTANPNGNYVDGEVTNKLGNTLIGLLVEWTNPIERASFKMSFNNLMANLRDTFNVFWFIDSDSKFRLEHEMYFVKMVDDSTPIVIPAIGEINKRKLMYEKSAIGSIEQFKWGQAGNTDFIGMDIIYNNFSTTDNIINHQASFTTDIKYLMDSEEASDSGLGLYHCNVLTGLGVSNLDLYEIIISTGVLSASAFPNVVFSWANLHPDYWTWGRMGEDATMNGTGVTMDSSARFLKQAGVRFFYSTAINPYTALTTTLTGGAPIEIKRDLETDFIEMIIGYDPYTI